MMTTDVTARDFRYDAFISYSRKDRNFAGRLERELRNYHPPKDLAVPQRRLRVFRDEEDFTGGEYHDSLDRCLQASSKLIVICSPNSASSPYVADEIRRFSEQRGKNHIIPILLEGIPNNEVRESDKAQGAFPEELLRVLPMPLAADYRGFDPSGDKFRKGPFAHAWFKTIADVYADHGIDRAAVEQRERRRELRRLRNLAAVSSSVALALIALTIWALLSRSEATRQRDNSEARRYEAEARLVFGGSADALTRATLFSVTSVRFAPTVDGHLSLARFLSLLPRPPLWEQALEHHAEGFGGGRRKALAFSPDGRRIASIAGDGPLQMLDARTGAPARSIELERQPADRTVAAFSPDGRFLVVGCGPVACVVDTTSDRPVTRLPRDENRHGSMVWAAAFSPDGQHLAVSSYGSGEVLMYEVPTWRILARLQAGSGTVFSVAFSPDGEWLVTAAPEGLQVWPRAAHYAAPVGQTRTSDLVWSIAFHPDNGGFVTGSRTVQAWRMVPGDGGTVQLLRAAAAPIEAHTVLSVEWHGRTCVAAATPDAVHLLCGDALDEVVRIPVSSTAAAITMDRRVLLNEQTDGRLAAWSLDAGLESFRLSIGSPVRSIATSDQRNWLAAGTDTGVVVVALDTWSERMRVPLPAAVTFVNASGDGRWLVVAEAASVHIYDATAPSRSGDGRRHRHHAELSAGGAGTHRGRETPRAHRGPRDAPDGWFRAHHSDPNVSGSRRTRRCCCDADATRQHEHLRVTCRARSDGRSWPSSCGGLNVRGSK